MDEGTLHNIWPAALGVVHSSSLLVQNTLFERNVVGIRLGAGLPYSDLLPEDRVAQGSCRGVLVNVTMRQDDGIRVRGSRLIMRQTVLESNISPVLQLKFGGELVMQQCEIHNNIYNMRDISGYIAGQYADEVDPGTAAVYAAGPGLNITIDESTWDGNYCAWNAQRDGAIDCVGKSLHACIADPLV